MDHEALKKIRLLDLETAAKNLRAADDGGEGNLMKEIAAVENALEFFREEE